MPSRVKSPTLLTRLEDDLYNAKKSAPLGSHDSMNEYFREYGVEAILGSGVDGNQGRWLSFIQNGIVANNAPFNFLPLTLEMVWNRTHMLTMQRR